MFPKTAENLNKNAEKIFKKTAKPAGISVLPHYIWDILLKVHREEIPPVTVSQIIKILKKEYNVVYSQRPVYLALNNIRMYIPGVELIISHKATPRNHARTFNIRFKIPLHKTTNP